MLSRILIALAKASEQQEADGPVEQAQCRAALHLQISRESQTALVSYRRACAMSVLCEDARFERKCTESYAIQLGCPRKCHGRRPHLSQRVRPSMPWVHHA